VKAAAHFSNLTVSVSKEAAKERPPGGRSGMPEVEPPHLGEIIICLDTSPLFLLSWDNRAGKFFGTGRWECGQRE